MNIPVIKFHKMLLEENVDLIQKAFFGDNSKLNFYNYVIKMFPKLSYIDEEKLSKEIILQKIKSVVIESYYNNVNEIEKSLIEYNKIWHKYNNKYMATISEYLNIEWPEKIKTINVNIGIIPFFPRYLDTFSFSLCPNLKKEMFMKIIAHEVLHFIWFEKWMELYPNTKKYELESPYKVWEYSEMVTDCIINSSKVSSIYKFNEKSYDYFYEIKNENVYLMDKIKEIFNSNDTIENKIKKGYTYYLNFKR